MDNVGTFIMDNILNPIWFALSGFWSDVLVPFGNNISEWVAKKAPAIDSFSDFCMGLFKIKYSLRVASFGIMFLVFIILISSMVLKRKKKRRKSR